MRNIGKKIARWWNGEFVQGEYDTKSGSYKTFHGHRQHWTSIFLNSIWKFGLREWKWIAGTALAIVALIAAFQSP